ncbi:MAG TPA: response regulator [Phenylobacterium sp.]|nr:response regulator [Phenylobacterium sp.]
MSISLARIKFLVVDDNVHAIDLVKTMLRGFGVDQVVEAQTIAEAKKALKAAPVDIVILDYLMGDEEGVTLARHIRLDPASPSPFVPIIMLTGHADRARVMAARDAGVNEFCIKPFTPADLMKRIMAVIDHPRPFVRSDSGYFGPDRRRRDDPKYTGPERRKDRQKR